MPLTFRTPKKRARHFQDHGSDFSATDALHYEQMARTFLDCPLAGTVLECIRPREGDIVRYNPVTEEFGIVSFDGHIRTYYTPDPAEHGLPTNLDYFNAHRNQT